MNVYAGALDVPIAFLIPPTLRRLALHTFMFDVTSGRIVTLLFASVFIVAVDVVIGAYVGAADLNG